MQQRFTVNTDTPRPSVINDETTIERLLWRVARFRWFFTTPQARVTQRAVSLLDKLRGFGASNRREIQIPRQIERARGSPAYLHWPALFHSDRVYSGPEQFAWRARCTLDNHEITHGRARERERERVRERERDHLHPLAPTKPLSRDEICETGPPRGIILNYVCPRLFRRFQRNARAARLSPAFVSPRARDQSGHHHSSYIFHVSIRSFPIRLLKNAPRRSLDPPPLFLVSTVRFNRRLFLEIREGTTRVLPAINIGSMTRRSFPMISDVLPIILLPA